MTRLRGSRQVLMALACAALGLTVGGTPAAAVPAPDAFSSTDDIVIAIDVTEMSADDFVLIKRGLASVVTDGGMPLDGSVSVAIIQYRNDGGSDGAQQSAQTMVPLKQVEGVAATTAIVSTIRRAPMMARETPSSGGVIRYAAEMLKGRKSESILGIISLGEPPEGLDLSIDRMYAQEQGLDAISVLTRSADQEVSTDFAKAVLGRGTLTSGGSLPDLLSQLTTALRGPAVSLRALEVNQVIQDWNNSIPLIAGKDTMVRAFFGGPAFTRVTARLWGYRDGIPLPGSPLSPHNASSYYPSNSSDVPRARLQDSLNFSLPYSWRFGEIQLRVAYAGPISCSAAPGVASDCTTSLTYSPTQVLDVDFFSIPYMIKKKRYDPSIVSLWEQMLRFRDQLPLASFTFDFRSLPQPTGANTVMLEDANAALLAIAAQETCADSLSPTCLKRYLGVFDSYTPQSGGAGGLANDIPGTVASFFLLDDTSPMSTGGNRAIGVHEIAHTLGAHHVVNQAVNGSQTFQNASSTASYKKGWCREIASDTAPEYPWFSAIPLSGTTPPMTLNRPTLGPLGNSDTEIWGANPRSILWNSPHTIINPRLTFPLMSYCRALAAGQSLWMSEPTYRTLFDGLREESAGPTLTLQNQLNDQILIRGIVNVIKPGKSRLDPIFPIEGAPAVDGPSDSPWSIELLDSAGSLLDKRALVIGTSSGYPVDGESVPPPETEPFAVRFDDGGDLADLSSVHLLFNDEVVSTLEASPSIPDVRILSPRPGSRIAGEHLTISWSSSDADGGTPTATVLYRSEESADWEVLALGVTATSVTTPRDRLAGSPYAQVRVIVSDGVNYAIADSGDFAVSNNKPLIVPETLTSAMTFIGNETVLLQADAWDAEDGVIGDGIRWTSDRDGIIGAGGTPLILASDLSEGVHTVSASVEDADGAATTLRVATVTIKHVDYFFSAVPPGPVIGVAAVASGKQLVVTWKPPADTGSSPVTEYTYSINGGGPVSTSSNRIALPLPKRGVTVTVAISARNSEAQGKAVTVTYRGR